MLRHKCGRAPALDGHNRYEICTRLGIEFETVEVEDCPDREAALAWIAANQLGRRNLDQSQKGALAVRLEKQLAEAAKERMALGGKMKGKAILPDLQRGQARDKAAEIVGVSLRYVQEAKQIERDAPEVLSAPPPTNQKR